MPEVTPAAAPSAGPPPVAGDAAPSVPGAVRRTVRRADVELSVLDAGDGPPVVLAHGFPELAWSWRHQIPALAAAGYRVLAPDQRGYGRSSRPGAVEDYDMVHLTDDLLGLLDDIGEERAVFVGHDWGAMVVWQLALRAPERVAGVVGMSVPFLPRSPAPPTQIFRQLMGDTFFYMLYFQEPGVADADLGRDPATTIRRMLTGLTLMGGDDAEGLAAALAGDGRGFVERLPEPETLPTWITADDLATYAGEFDRTGFTGGIDWYRNLDRNWEQSAHLDGRTVAVPALYVGGADDPVLLMTPPEVMDGWLDDDRGRLVVEGAGHWIQQEAPDAVNRALLDFLAGVWPPA